VASSEIKNEGFDMTPIFPLILDTVPVAVTVTDAKGYILYFNQYSQDVLDRKPEYIGRDIRFCHKESTSIEKIDSILEAFRMGGESEVYYEAVREGTRFAVTVRPLRKNGHLLGCVHCVIKK
jgi:PAS domain S-box-containing protein